MNKKTVSISMDEALEQCTPAPVVARAAMKAFEKKIVDQIEGALREIEGQQRKKGVPLRLTMTGLQIDFDL